MSAPVAIVTGSSRGIGEATALALARVGFAIVTTGRDLQGLERVAAEIVDRGGRAAARRTDVGEEAPVVALFDFAFERFGRLDVVVNNAGILVTGAVEALPIERFDEVMRVNVRGTFLCAREAFRRLISQGSGGAIVNVASLSGVAAVDKFPGYSAYVASKFAVVGLTEALAVEGRAHGIRVNCVSPGAVDTAMLRQGDPSLRARATPADIARSIVFLATDPLISGTNLPIFCNA